MPSSASVRVAATLAAVLLTASGCAGGGESARPTSSAGPADGLQAHVKGTVVTPPFERPHERLSDDQGAVFSLADRPTNELTVLFFGYTHCPDFCPTTAADLAAARRQLPPELRARVTVAFVTEDPDRDTPGALRRWLDRFDPSFVGLIGGNSTTAAMIKSLYSSATARVADPEKPIRHPASAHQHRDHGHYGIEHSSIVYVFAPGGRSLIYSGGATSLDYASDFATLLR